MVSALAWKNGSRSMPLLLCKVDDEVTVKITGLPGGEANVYRIDGSSEQIQFEVTGDHQIAMSGYTILLISSI